MGAMIADPKMQDAADAAYSRQIWWEMTKLVLEKTQGITLSQDKTSIDVADEAVKQFKKRCESGFFDVKRVRE